MGTFLKYFFYILIIVVIYFIGIGFYQGNLNKDSSLGDMANHVTSNTKQVIKNGYDSTKEAVQNGVAQMKEETDEGLENGEEMIENGIETITSEPK